MVNIPFPPTVLEPNVNPLFYELGSNTLLVRISGKEEYFKFRKSTKQSHRFDHLHIRADKPGDPKKTGTDTPKEADRGILYACPVLNHNESGFYEALSTSIAEVFGAVPRLFQPSHFLGVYKTANQIKLLDLRKDGSMSVGTVAAVMSTRDRNISQRWSECFYNSYSDLDGIIYSGAYNRGDCIALYERAQEKVSLLSKEIKPLKELQEDYRLVRILNTLRIEKAC